MYNVYYYSVFLVFYVRFVFLHGCIIALLFTHVNTFCAKNNFYINCKKNSCFFVQNAKKKRFCSRNTLPFLKCFVFPYALSLTHREASIN